MLKRLLAHLNDSLVSMGEVIALSAPEAAFATQPGAADAGELESPLARETRH